MVSEDFDELLDFLLGFAQKTKSDHGELHPFGATMAPDGSVLGIMVDIPEEGLDSYEIVSLLVQQLRQQASEGELKACAICSDIHLHVEEDDSESEAIQVQLEHAEGDPISVFLPYAKGEDGKFQWGELSGTDGVSSVFDKES